MYVRLIEKKLHADVDEDVDADEGPISLSQATITSKSTSDIIWLPNLRRSCDQCLNQYHIPVTGSIVELSILDILSFIRTF